MEKIYLFVYGTLKRGYLNHGFLENEEYLGKTKTLNKYVLVNLLRFPGLVEQINKTQIEGEVYKISNKKLKELDMFEGSYYYRKKIPLECGIFAWTYFLKKFIQRCPEIDSGSW